MVYGGIIRFSEILKTATEVPSLIEGCIVDTSILFAAGYPPDKFNQESEELFEYLAELEMPPFTNVNIRAEFMDLFRRVMVPEGLSDLYTSHGKDLDRFLFTRLQSAYTPISESRKSGRPYKFNEEQIKSWRRILRPYRANDCDGWQKFCADFLQGKIEKIWDETCDKLGINFLSLREEDQPDWLTGELSWSGAATLIGKFGIGSFDAMIVNLLLNSRFTGIVTADRDIAYAVDSLKPEGKYVIVPDSLDL
jgi:hypothetical protein